MGETTKASSTKSSAFLLNCKPQISTTINELQLDILELSKLGISICSYFINVIVTESEVTAMVSEAQM